MADLFFINNDCSKMMDYHSFPSAEDKLPIYLEFYAQILIKGKGIMKTFKNTKTQENLPELKGCTSVRRKLNPEERLRCEEQQ